MSILGNPVPDNGAPGDLICTVPFPSMPVAFWNDTPDKAAYRAAYFNKFEGVWAHGDFLLINPKTKGVVILFLITNDIDCYLISIFTFRNIVDAILVLVLIFTLPILKKTV